MRKALPAIFVVVALTLIVVTGVLAYNTGLQTGLTQQTNIRNEFLSTRVGGSNQAGNFPTGGNQGGANQSGGNQAAAAFRGGGIFTVKSVQGNTILVTAQDGSTVTVNVNAQTVYEKPATATLTDIQPGTRIIVAGGQGGGQGNASASSTASGAITARTIQIQPAQ